MTPPPGLNPYYPDPMTQTEGLQVVLIMAVLILFLVVANQIENRRRR